MSSKASILQSSLPSPTLVLHQLCKSQSTSRYFIFTLFLPLSILQLSCSSLIKFSHLRQSTMKLLWLLENMDSVKEAVKKGDVMFGMVDTWLIWNMTRGVGNSIHITDESNASRTMLVNLKTLDWDKPTLDLLGIPADILPKIVSNSEIIGNISKGWPITDLPISSCLRDQHAAMVGQTWKKCEANSTYRTDASVLLNIGSYKGGLGRREIHTIAVENILIDNERL